MRRKLFLLLTIWFSSLAGMSQNIVYFEYYVDEDPGYNLANPVTVVASSITELNFTIPTTGLSKGFHFAGMRGRDQNGKWSTDFHNLFYIGLLQSESDFITYVEYFIDTDPGFGNAVPVSITPGKLVDLSFNVDLEGLEPGFHFINVRTKSEAEVWSQVYSQMYMFDVLNSEVSPITYVEYYLDSDPGFGNAVPVSITPGKLVDLSFNVDLEGLEPGFHFIHVRSKTGAEVWSQVYSQMFMMDVLNSEESPITYVEYYLDSDPGFGNAVPVSITPGKLVDLSFNVDLEGLDPGIHFINIRSKSENENWCEVYSQFFLLNNYSSAGYPNITLLEYFVDSDPGFGDGTIIPVNPPTTLVDKNFVANIASFTPGEHKFFARAKDEFENWSIVAIDTFNVEQGTEFALRFDGENDYLGAGNAILPENDFTIEAWINPDQITDIHEIVYGFGENSGIQFRVNYDGSLLYGEWNGSLWNWVISDSLTILPGQWTHVAVTKEGNICTLFINGSSVSSDLVDNNPFTTTFNFGGRSDVNDRFFNGEMDEIRIWNVARTPQDILAGLCADFTGNEAGIYGLWHFDDGTGSPVAMDSGPNIMDVTLHNMNINEGADCSWTGYECSLFYADFFAEPLTGLAPLEVQFTDLSTRDPDTWYWDFGDGSTSNFQNPAHIYNSPGIYTVSLTVTNPSLSSTKTRVDYIEVLAPEPLIADFSADVTSGYAPLEVQFSDLSTGDPDTWHWDFGDGSASNLQNPEHIYNSPGIYSISLTVTNPSSSSTKTRIDCIEVMAPEPLNAIFSADVTSGYAPLEVQFSDLSTGNPDTWHWDFGDGSASNLENPAHIYNTPGIYTVNLYVTNPSSSSTKTRVDYIEVVAPEPLIADFSADVTSGYAPLEVHFTDLSTGEPKMWDWDFGDGSTSNLQNPVHVYSGFGSYKVSLTVFKNDLENTIVKNGYITVFQTENGDWSLQQVCIVNTPEAQLMIRSGDIDNLGFGWPQGFDPFSGQSTPIHTFPWTPDPADIGGTDRIMVVSGFTGSNIPCDVDGYTYSTLRPENLPEPVLIELCQPPQGEITSASLQIFVDDIQPLTFCSEYTVKLNGFTFSNLQTIINSLNQTGPIGRMLTVPIPDELLYLLEGSQLELEIDDFTTGAGDGFAIDFVKLLINENTLVHSGTIAGTVFDAETNLPVVDAEVEASFWETVTTNDGGLYTISEVPAGMVYLECRKPGYITSHQIINLESGTTFTADFWLEPELNANFEAYPISGNAPLEVQFSDLSTGNPNTWFWNFGDGTTSTEQNPFHTYTTAGWFDVSLMVSNGSEQDLIERQAYISVTEMPSGEKVAEYFFDVDPGFGSANPVYSEDGNGLVAFNPDVSNLPEGQHTLYVRTRGETGSWSQTLNRPFLVVRLNQDNLPEISKMEYFMDNDPGYGNGTMVNVDPTPIIEIPVEISLWNYPDGIRNLYFRVLDNQGKWSETVCRSFLKSTLPTDYTGITRMEYFVDNDPGYGYGNVVEIQQIAGTVSQSIIADLSGQEAGKHSLSVRAADNCGKWSLVYTALFNVEPGTGTVQIIELNEGWSGISGYVIPEDPILENLFTPVGNDLVILQNFDGIFWPSAGVNTLVNWDTHAGYQVKMETAHELTLTGTPEQELNILFNQGWNYLPVPTACSHSVAELLSPISDQLDIVKEVAGTELFWPQFNINTLLEIEQGKAYFIKVNEPVNLEFPSCTIMKNTSSKHPNLPESKLFLPLPGLNISPTPITHLVAIPSEVAIEAVSGNIFKVSNTDGKCFGSSVFLGQNFALTAFGDDPTTIPVDGFLEGEPMLFSLCDPKTRQEFYVNIQFDESQPNGGNFTNHGVSAIRCLKVDKPDEYQDTELSATIAPNPSNGIFQIIAGEPTILLSWQISNAKGKVIITETSPGGRFKIDLSPYPKGIYYLKIVFNGKQVVKKLVLN